MDTASTSESVTLMLPNADLSFLRTLSKKMGWTFRRHRKTGIEKGLDDIKKGKVYHAKNSEDLIKQMQNIALIDFMVIMKDVGNVILHQIGC